MIVEFNLTNIIFVIIALLSGGWTLIKLAFAQFDKAQDTRHKSVLDHLQKNQEATQTLERDFMAFKAEIPRTYLRRDDYLREAQLLRESISTEIAPIRLSVHRIEDYLIQK